MSDTQWSPVVLPRTFSIPANPGNAIIGPLVFYTLSPSEVSRIEAVTFKVVVPTVTTWATTFRIELTDPSGDVLYQYATPIFEED